MKTDAIEFETYKTVQEIARVLRAQECDIDYLEDDPLSEYDDGPASALAVSLEGKVKFRDAFKHILGGGGKKWGVQVVVYELGNARLVLMIALGECGFWPAMSAYGSPDYISRATAYFNMRQGKDHRDRIAEQLGALM